MREAADGGVALGQARVVHSTGEALLCDVDGLGKVWVPCSVVHDDSEVYGSAEDRNSGKLVVKSWWARKQGWD